MANERSVADFLARSHVAAFALELHSVVVADWISIA